MKIDGFVHENEFILSELVSGHGIAVSFYVFICMIMLIELLGMVDFSMKMSSLGVICFRVSRAVSLREVIG